MRSSQTWLAVPMAILPRSAAKPHWVVLGLVLRKVRHLKYAVSQNRSIVASISPDNGYYAKTDRQKSLLPQP
ncbi:hypothetical protein [Coleofasciculus chthonoplastes]|uniref:hypothetical protein n=1 Tax=Coleofasciculus chthonoplastes TaxID=64178 RepID=UPI001E4C3B4E|nr:hypothetical protein [Coleofasciculus chthonoplastes]